MQRKLLYGLPRDFAIHAEKMTSVWPCLQTLTHLREDALGVSRLFLLSNPSSFCSTSSSSAIPDLQPLQEDVGLCRAQPRLLSERGQPQSERVRRPAHPDRQAGCHGGEDCLSCLCPTLLAALRRNHPASIHTCFLTLIRCERPQERISAKKKNKTQQQKQLLFDTIWRPSVGRLRSLDVGR